MSTITKILVNGIPYDLGVSADVRHILDTLPYVSTVYGVMWDYANPSPECVRIGNMTLHKTLPIQSKMAGGLMTDDGTFTPFDNQDDWSGETLDGSAGQVMVCLPQLYYKFVSDGTKRFVLFSETPVSGFFESPMQYVSAMQATVQRSTLKLCSVANIDPDFRGGNNNAAWDGTYRSLLGLPATSISLTNFRTYARNRNNGDTRWNCHTYEVQRLLYWLFVVEYATLNTQKAYNATLDANGFRQGGLGGGVTDWNGNSWNSYNGYYPLIPCGYTSEYGNATAQKRFDLYGSDGVTLLHTFQVPRYRGIENPFGHIWEWTDGILINKQAADSGGKSPVYVTTDPALFSSTDFSKYDYLCDEIRTEAFIKTIHFGDHGDIICTSTPGSSSTYHCNYWYGANLPSSGTSLRGVHFGGTASYGAGAGLVYGYSYNAPGTVYASIGSRLCFKP